LHLNKPATLYVDTTVYICVWQGEAPWKSEVLISHVTYSTGIILLNTEEVE
jgi:hypothetical protein